ncbi:hypothetical protein ESZ36_18820 [Colwellia demingiae]|uniref:Uncharacterized protein n=1 Tax=Colwellia demingiae TaxID=89401 RepID=A0A5C6Q6Z1_9GAMM|nr:hypothetical protein [Colwellia demingiae]TWX64754.1 hypothetical protein ESZ36_18820 [Colwellia demingiae]
MSKVIEVLMQMASNAEMSNTKSLAEMLSNANLTKAQELAIQTKDMDALKVATYNLPEIRCYPILLPDDKSEEVSTLINRTVANF